ncbi:MAG: 2-oxoacid:acceptor oxidoreductase family protein [Bryobacteraceae bacterium]|nr:2-oxoacid:acceptor oxidoreductase family protein [Bryobacteraceae bacterium]
MNSHPDGKVTSVVVAGLGGQGVLTASEIVAVVAFRAGLDVKKSEIHGMSQRGGSVTSDVRFGPRVFSPMTPAGEADFVVALAADQADGVRGLLRAGGCLITPSAIDEKALRSKKSLNVALLGALSARLAFSEQAWLDAIRAVLPPKFHAVGLEAFLAGRKGNAC